MLSRYRGKTDCPECKGTRLRKDAAYVKINGKSILDLVLLPMTLKIYMARAEITAFVCLSSFTSAIGLIGAKTTSRTVSYPVNPFKLYQQWCYEKHYQHQNSNTQRSWAFLSRLPLIQKQKGATQPTFSQQPLTLHPPLSISRKQGNSESSVSYSSKYLP